jgi:hypothetical protein
VNLPPPPPVEALLAGLLVVAGGLAFENWQSARRAALLRAYERGVDDGRRVYGRRSK